MFYILVKINFDDASREKPGHAKCKLKDDHDPFGIRHVVHHVADDDKSQQKRCFKKEYLFLKGCVVDSHAALKHTYNVEFDHA